MTKYVGIDIGHSSIKVATLSLTKKGPYIESIDIFGLPINPNDDRDLAVLEILRALRDKNAGQDCIYTLSIAQSKVAYRYKTFPFTEKIKILKALPFELEEDLPFSLDNAFWDARIVRQIGTESDVLAAAVTQHQIKKLMDNIGSLGLNIKKVIPHGNALHNVLAPVNESTWKISPKVTDESQAENKKLKLYLDIGHKETVVNLYEDNVWVDSSVILWGGYNLVKSVADRYEIGLDEAYKVVQEKSFVLIQLDNASYEQIVFSETLASELKNLARELNLIQLGFENSHKGTIEEIYVTGGTSRLIHIAPYLTQLLEISVNNFSYLDRWHYNPNLDTHMEPFVASAIGLALEGLRKSSQPQFQFLQGIYAQKNTYLENFWNSAKDSLIWGSAIIATLWIWSSVRVQLSEELLSKINDRVKQAGQIIADLPAKQSNPSQIKNYIKNAKYVILERQLFESVTQRASALDILKWISEKFPDKSASRAQVLELSIIDSNVKIKGITTTPQEKNQILNSLKSLSTIQNVQDLSSTDNMNLNIEFNLKNRDK